MPAEWTDAELDLLSAYIDEQLDDSERTALEARLAQDADLRQELAAMRQTVALLRDLPTIRAPRAFTLTPEMVGQKAVPMLTIAPAPTVQEKQQRPTRRVWWIPAASAAGVVLLAGIFAVTQLKAPMASPSPNTGDAVAVQSTATLVQDPSTLNIVVDLRLSATSATTAMPSATAAPTNAPLLARTDAKIEPSQDQSQDSTVPEEQTTQDEENVNPAPPVQGPAATFQPTQSSDTEPMPEPVEAETNAGFAPRMSASPTPANAFNMQQESAIVLATPTPDPLSMPSGGGMAETTVAYQTGDTVPIDSPAPEMVTGMNSVNTNPGAPGFSVSTVAPVQATIIAQYHAPTDQIVDTGSTMNEVLPTATAGVFAASESTSRPPIWIRWFNTLSDWFGMLLGQR